MLTERLALGIAGYALAAGIGVLLDPDRFMAMLDGLRERAASAYMTGVAVYFIGAGILIAHWKWDTTLEIAVTAVGCAAVAEGVAFLVAPKGAVDAMHLVWRRNTVRAWGAVSAAFGAWMAGLAVGAF
ncbi:MAG: hypothetical protein INR68_03250 [Methylobacterium mesophilicum]|nr:hypothetical protein [Methylobacterium mesophilicum]